MFLSRGWADLVEIQGSTCCASWLSASENSAGCACWANSVTWPGGLGGQRCSRLNAYVIPVV